MSDQPLQGLQTDPDSEISLFDQVYTQLRQRITTGQLKSGDKLPASRKLAEESGLSRTTILNAYDQLAAEGYVEGRKGAGMFVCDLGATEFEKPSVPVGPTVSSPSTVQRRVFAPGSGDDRLFPARQWGKYVARIARTDPSALVQTGDIFGNPALRAAICRYLSEWRGMNAHPEQVIITAGAGDGLEIILRSMMRKDDLIAFENPGYQTISWFATDMGLTQHFMGMDDAGSIPPAHPARLAMITPSSQFPLGGAMPLARRSAFLSWAEACNGYVIEDDYDSEFRYAGRPLPALAANDPHGRVIYVGSFTKVFNTGIRLGYIVLPPNLIEQFRLAQQRTGIRASAMPQQPLAAFMEDGAYYRHIRKMRRIYTERRQCLIELLQKKAANNLTFDDHKAGMHMAVFLPTEIDDRLIVKEAAQKGLGCSALSTHYQASESRSGLLLGYCNSNTNELQEGFDKLLLILDSALPEHQPIG